MTRSARELHAAAVAAANRGDFAGSRRLLDRAQHRADDADTLARILGTRAYVVARAGDIVIGEQLGVEALAVGGISPETFAILAGQMGSLAEHAGRLADAEQWLTRGISALEIEGEALANLMINRSLVHMHGRNLADAESDAAHASALFGRLGMAADEAQARHNQGYIALLRGDLVRAMQLMTAARPALVEMSPLAAAIGDGDRAEVLRDAGLVSEAERILIRNATFFGSQRMPHYRAESEFHLARSLLTHDPRAARHWASMARRRFMRLGNTQWALRADSVRLRAALAVGGPTRDTIPMTSGARHPKPQQVAEVVASLNAAGYRDEAAALRLASSLSRIRRGLPDDAIVRTPPAASTEVRVLAEEVRTARAVARGRGAEARRHAATALDELARWQRDFGALDLQTSVAMHATGLIFAGLTSAVDSGRPDLIFEWSERARHLSIQVVPLRPPPDPALAADLAELRMLRADGQQKLLDTRAAELQASARERQWATTGALEVEGRASIDELRADLGDDTAFIGFVFTDHGLTALVMTSQTVRVVPLPHWESAQRAMAGLRSDLDMAANVRTGPLARIVRDSLDQRLAALSRAILDEPVRVADRRRLVFTAPGVLAGMPWSMLPALRGRAFTLAGSASRWVHRHHRVAAPVAEVAFAVGPRVPRAEEEVRVAAASWQHPLIALPADVDDVIRLATSADLLHIAAHGKHAVENPLFSGLELADGALFGYDIDGMPRVPRTVILSACESGRSSVRWGEEAIGMTRIWLHAGSLCVIAAPVVVADDDACELLAATHTGLAAGLAPAEALAAASVATGLVSPFQTHGAGL